MVDSDDGDYELEVREREDRGWNLVKMTVVIGGAQVRIEMNSSDPSGRRMMVMKMMSDEVEGRGKPGR